MPADHSPSVAPDPSMAAIKNMFKPPIIRWVSGEIQKSLFTKTYGIAAASVKDNRNISRYRQQLMSNNDLLQLDRVGDVAHDPDTALVRAGKKCLLLRPGIVASAPETWGEILKEGVRQDHLAVVPYDLTLTYDHWTPRDILESILPEEFSDDLPGSFNSAGHVAHLNLRSNYLPYKFVIGSVILDKNPRINTVINKVDSVGDETEFRTFRYEVLAGEDNMNVEVHENDCTYRFDYSKVYWNSKLDKEHARIANLPRPGEVLCDVMAGIGPFTIPAAKRKVFVWANDMNPESFAGLQNSIKLNKASQKFVRPYNLDGRDFIRLAADSVFEASARREAVVLPPPKHPRGNRQQEQERPRPKPEPEPIYVPPTIAHFVMNLPASAITFLPRFKGIYAGREELFAPRTETKLPLVHVHCFAVKAEGDSPKLDICERVSKELGLDMKLGHAEKDHEISVLHVRDVAPSKSMYCASFRLPPEVAFALRE